MTKSRYAVLIWAFLLSVFLFVGTASAATYSVNGTTYPMIYNGTYASQNINYMVNYSNGYDLFWNGGLLQSVWDGVYAYDMIAYPENGTAISPWTFWHVESYNPTNKKWGETIPISNQFIKIDNSTLKRVMTMGSGERFNITYHNYGTKIKQDLELTTSLARIYRLTYRIDSVAAQDVSVDTKKFTPGFFNNFTLFDVTDVQPFTVNSTFNETSGLWEGDGSYLYGWNTTATIDNTNRKMYFTLTNGQVMAIGQKVNIDPSWSTNGSTTPAWQNTSGDHTVSDNPSGNIVIGMAYISGSGYPNNMTIYATVGYTPTWSVSNGIIKQTNLGANSESKFYYANVNETNITILVQANQSDNPIEYSRVGIAGRVNDTNWSYVGALRISTANTVRSLLLASKDGTNIFANTSITPSLISNTWYSQRLDINGNSLKYYLNDTSYLTKTDSSISYGSVGLYCFESDSCNYKNFRAYRYQQYSGNLTAWYNFGAGRQGAKLMFNFTNSSTSFVDAYASTDNFTTSNVLVASNITNTTWVTIPASAKNQTQYVRAVLKGNTTSTPELIEVSIEDEAVGGDTTSPTYSGASHNQTIAGLPTLFSIQYNDETALHPNGQWIFSTNNTGEWVNESAVNWTATPEWANVTKTLNSTVDTVIGYRWYANDNAGNINNTPIYTLTVTVVNYIPPTPINLINTTGNFWVNHSVEHGIGNITDSLNKSVSVNGSALTWTNNTPLFLNTTASAHATVESCFYAFNNTGIMNTTGLCQNTTVPNNAPVQVAIGNKNVTAGQQLNFTVSATDADSDAITYGTNASKGTLNTTTGNFNWSPASGDVGTYYWNFNSSDGYGGVDDETITVSVGQASASNIAIVNHTIVDNGTSKFPTFFWNLCMGQNATRCTANLAALPNVTMALGGNTIMSFSDYIITNMVIPLNASQNYWTVVSSISYNTTFINDWRGSPYFFAYFVCDEPYDGTPWSTCQDRYTTIRTNDLTNLTYIDTLRNMTQSSTMSDIIFYDGYRHATGISGQYWNIEDWIYAKEQYVFKSFIQSNHTSPAGCPTCTGLDDVAENKSTMIIGEAWKYPSYTEGSATYVSLTANESRAETYAFITMGTRGVGWYTYEIWADGNIGGIRGNTTQTTQYDNLAGEIKSLEQILLMNTSNYSWGYNHSDNRVTFNNNPTKVIGSYSHNYLNYIIKENSTDTYLIVVNKDQNATTTSVNISGLSGTMTATTLGTVGTGSSSPGRTITVTNGNFTDTFDGYAVHIYEIPLFDISYISPTPNNNSIISVNYINVSVGVSSSTDSSITLDWNRLLKLWLRMEETTGLTVVDSSGSGNNGTWQQGTTVNTTTGVRGNGFVFSGSDTVNLTSINLTNNYTISGWFNSTETSITQRYILSKNIDALGNCEYCILYERNASDYSKTPLTFIANGAVRARTNSTLQNNTLYHFAITSSSSDGIRMYINGALNGTTGWTYTTSITPTAEITIIGGRKNSTTSRFKGMLDDIKIHNRVLTPSEIYADYNGANGLSNNFTSLADGPHNATAFVQDSTGAIANTETRYWTVDTSIPTEAQFTKVEFLWWE